MTGDPVSAGADRFLAAEIHGLSRSGPGPLCELTVLQDPADGAALPVDIAAIGTTAGRAVRGELLAHAVSATGFVLRTAVPRDDPGDLFADPVWQLGVVLSPWKRQIGGRCHLLAPSAVLTGVVDTVVRTPRGAVGFNTNTWAALTALEGLTGGATPRRLLLLGAGASARSVALAVNRAWPACDLVIAARSTPAAEELAVSFRGRSAGTTTVPSGSEGYQVVVNTTTWGETEASESEPFGLDLEGVLAPGVGLFDLNNRIGALAVRALAAGCVVASGATMQRVTNASRAALLRYAHHGQVDVGQADSAQ